jgi:hypothetical protein
MTRTCDLRFRKPLLYPAELRDHHIEIAALSQSLVRLVGMVPEASRQAPIPRPPARL